MAVSSESLDRDAELRRTVGAHVARISAETGLREPAINLVRSLGSGKPSINAQFRTPKGVPTIKITWRAVQELSHDGLRFLLTHEFGHLANVRFRRWHWWWSAIYLIGALIAIGGLVELFTSITTGNTGQGLSVVWLGLFVALGGLLASRAHSRIDERRADNFAVRAIGDLLGARAFFTVLEEDKPEKLPSAGLARNTVLLWRSHPYHYMRLHCMQEVLTRSGTRRSTR